MKAWNLTRSDMHYRHGAFSTGMSNAGLEVRKDSPVGAPGNVLLMWNRYGHYHDQAVKFEAAGGKVIVVENGYFGKDTDGNQLYAISIHGHNGSGSWNVGGPERWDGTGTELKPWRPDGNHVLVCGQRGIGSPTMASPPGWHDAVAARLQKLTKRPIKIRLHPGQNAPKTLLSDDLAGAWACVIWSSASGIQSLAAGIPVFFDAPHWICEGAAKRGVTAIESPLMDDSARLAAFQRMAWAQWSLAEIESGEPFKRLLA